ncbi:MAG: hypothetical protein QGH06_06160 [Lutibacter sp.]|nr:hypothetical protein [Lutibacter sp.]
MIGQNDSLRTDFVNETGQTQQINNLQGKLNQQKVGDNAPLNLQIDKQVDQQAIEEQLAKNTPTTKGGHFLMETLPEDADIKGKHYWKGQDVTHKKLESHANLGTVYTQSKIARIECRDHSYVDGDRIKIYLNEQEISSNIGLKGSYFVVYLNLKEGYNRVDFQALNQGLSGPNTAELNLYDEQGVLLSSKEWNLATGSIATIGVIRK